MCEQSQQGVRDQGCLRTGRGCRYNVYPWEGQGSFTLCEWRAVAWGPEGQEQRGLLEEPNLGRLLSLKTQLSHLSPQCVDEQVL